MKKFLCCVLLLVFLVGCKRAEKKDNVQQETNTESIELISSAVPCIDSKYHIYDITEGICKEGYDVYITEFLGDGKVFALSQKYDNGDFLSYGCVYDYSKNNLDASIDFDGDFLTAFVGTEYIYVIKYDHVVEKYSFNLEKTGEISIEGENLQTNYAFNNEKNELYMLSETNELSTYNLTDGTRKRVKLTGINDGGYIYGYDSVHGELIIGYEIWNEDEWQYFSGVIPVKTGEFKENNIYSDGYVRDGMFYCRTDNAAEVIWRKVGNNRVENTLYIEYDGGAMGEIYIDKSEKYALTVEYGEFGNWSLKIYDIESGNKKVSIDAEYIINTLKWYQIMLLSNSYDKSGVIPIGVYVDETYHMYLFDVSKIAGDAENGGFKDETSSGFAPADEESVAKKAESVENAYSIDIKYGAEVLREYPDFDVTVCLDWDTLDEALDIIDEVFERCPDGFFEYFEYEGVNGLNIYLTGTLIQGNEEGISNPAAFALVYDSEQMIVADVTYISTLDTTIAHELSHCIDNVIGAYTSTHDFDGYYDEWYDLNPEGYDYNYSYQVDGEDISADNRPLYTPADYRYEENTDIAYFASPYGNSFPTEDRSTIFEHLLGQSEFETLPDFYKSKNIQAKAEFMFRTIRTVFGIDDDETVYWETKLYGVAG